MPVMGCHDQRVLGCVEGNARDPRHQNILLWSIFQQASIFLCLRLLLPNLNLGQFSVQPARLNVSKVTAQLCLQRGLRRSEWLRGGGGGGGGGEGGCVCACPPDPLIALPVISNHSTQPLLATHSQHHRHWQHFKKQSYHLYIYAYIHVY